MFHTQELKLSLHAHQNYRHHSLAVLPLKYLQKLYRPLMYADYHKIVAFLDD